MTGLSYTTTCSDCDRSAYDYLNSIYFVKQITSLNEYMPMSLSADVVGIL